jgi:hypothetical protein
VGTHSPAVWTLWGTVAFRLFFGELVVRGKAWGLNIMTDQPYSKRMSIQQENEDVDNGTVKNMAGDHQEPVRGRWKLMRHVSEQQLSRSNL